MAGDNENRGIHYLTASQMVDVDRAMVDEFHIELHQMMENAGRNLAHLARQRFLPGQPVRKRVAVLADSAVTGEVLAS